MSSALRISFSSFGFRAFDNAFENIRERSGSEKTASNFSSLVSDQLKKASVQPFSFPPEPVLTEDGSQYFIIMRYKIIYHFTKRDLIVTDEFHTRQDPNKISERNLL